MSLGRHQLLFPVGHGGMSYLYLALVNSAAGVNRVLVIKQPRASLLDDPESLAMFMDEARLASRLHHPNVVQTFEVGQEGPIPYITMEFLDGQPLHRISRRLGVGREQPCEVDPLSLGMRLRIIADMLDGLHYAHELRDYDGAAMQVIHRDVSPQNLFLTYDGQIKLVDFGIAKASDSVTRSESSGLKGKLAYMSPQQAGGEPLDRRADVFSAGVMLWELVSGRRLWAGCSEATVARRLVDRDLPDLTLDPDTVPAAVLGICRRALAPEVEQRYPSAEAFRSALERVMLEQGLDATARAIGKRVAQAFCIERAEVRARIDRALLGLVDSDGPTRWELSSQRDRIDQIDRIDEITGFTRGSDESEAHTSTPDEVTADYGPKLAGVPAPEPEPEPPAPSREASGTIGARALPLSRSRDNTPPRVVVGVVALMLVAFVAVLFGWRESRAVPVATPVGAEHGRTQPRPAAPLAPVEPPNCDAADKPRVPLSGEIDEDATLRCDRDYVLRFNTRVVAGATLTIEAGTTIFGERETTGALIIEPGARLIASGTPERPIVFTSSRPEAERQPGDWGGVLLLGRAPINLRDANGRPILGEVEGVTGVAPYGGDDPNDDSGVLRYVRIEYPGVELAPGNEINGLTLAGVGRGTTIDHVEVLASSDDCFEFFGGTVDAKHLVCVAPGDDGLDFDNGYQGRIQFVVVHDRVQGEADTTPSNAFEFDNDPNGSTAEPRTRPVIWNATLCGVTNPRAPSHAILARRAAQPELAGLLVSGFDYGLDRHDRDTFVTLRGVALVRQSPGDLSSPDFDGAWSSGEGFGFLGCDGPLSASLLPATPIVPSEGFEGPPDDGFFDPNAAWIGAFADADDDWTSPWVVWTQAKSL
ncbi:serine/threonine protein kinase [Enhygromyxa salina]|uniref:Serine/threonine protein kinase n=1 Tax=Enhygromyxa salina TaxID=215803 RepID=A0A0C2D1I0_9BACT|nr:serine/threonine protein kinase [Enhygromyxa salina]